MKRLALLSLIAITAASCSPVYRTNYNLLPPPTREGQICTNAVKTMSDTCVANCNMMSRSCRSFGSSIGIGYGNGWGRHEGAYGTFGDNSLIDDRDCNPGQCIENCLASARTAHTSCGGTITQQTVCTANCDKSPPPPAQH